MVSRSTLLGIVGQPGVRLAAMGLAGLLVIASLSNLAIGVTFGFNFDDLPEDLAAKSGQGGGSIPPGFIPPPGDYSELIKQYDGEIPPYATGDGSQGSDGTPSSADPGSGGEPGSDDPGSGDPGGQPPSGSDGAGQGGESPWPDRIPEGAAEAIRPGAGENSFSSIPDMPDGGKGFGSGNIFQGLGNFMSNPMDPKAFLVFLGVIAGGVAAAVGLRYLLAWLRERNHPAPREATSGAVRRLEPRPLPPDPRTAVLVAYETFTIHARKHGVEYAEHETPREFAHRAVSVGLAPDGPALRLTDLYEEARLSTHPIPKTYRASAVDCLNRMAAPPVGA